MDSNHMNATSVIGMPNSAPTSKLKSGSSVSSSPGSVNFNNCTKSPLSGNFNNGRRSASPFFSDSKSEDILSKNGAGMISGSSLSIIHGGNYPDPTASPPCATAQNTSLSSAASQGKRESSKMSSNPSSDLRNANVALIGLPHSNDGKGNSASSKRDMAPGRSEKRVQINHTAHGEKHRNVALTRHANNFHRHNSADCSKEAVANTIKSKDKGSSRQSPRDFMNDHSGRHLGGYESPTISYPSPSSSENALTTTTVARGKTKGHERGPGTPVTSTAPTHMSNHLSRTSSSNSVSDLSRCSEVTDESQAEGGNMAVSASSESMHSRVTYSPAAGGQVEMESTLYSRYEDSAIADALGFTEENHSSVSKPNTQLSLEGASTPALNTDEVLPNDSALPNIDFAFPDGSSGQADLGQKALNLSAEDIRQTLNSVSAESGLPDLGSDSAVFDDQAMLMNNGTGYDMAPSSDSFSSADASRVLSPSVTVSATASTSPTTSIVTSAVSSTATTMPSSATNLVPPNVGKPFGNEAFPGGGTGFSSSQATTPSSTTPVSFSPSAAPSAGGKSHLQEILGVTDTIRLQNMARPVDSAQIPSTTTTSFSSNILNQPGQVMPNSSTGPVQNLPSSRFRHFTPPSGGNNFQRHPVHPRTPNAYGGPPHSPHNMLFDGPNMNPGAPNYMEPNMSPRSNMGYDPGMQGPHHPHPGPGGNMPPYHPMWPRPMGSMMPNLGPGSDGSKSPRGSMGPGSNFANRPLTPMSALQGTVNAISEGFSSSPGIGSMAKNNNNNMGPPNSFQGMPPSSGMGDFPPMCSPVGRTMLPPPSPLSQSDKRSFSSDGTTKKGHKRERGQSVDSKDGDKQAPKSKRRKSKSKDESKKTSVAESKTASRSNSVSDTQGNNQLLYIFNSEIANMAANVVNQGKSPTIVSYHQTSQRGCRIAPSKPGSLAPGGPGPILSKSPSQQPGDHNNHSFGPPPGRQIKSESNLTSPRPSVKEEAKSRTGQNVKTEFNQSNDGNNGKHLSPPLPKQDTSEENLSEEQKHHREEALSKLRSIGQMLEQQTDGNSNAGPVPPPSNGRWQSTSAGNYAMTNHLKEIQKNNPAYNDHKRRNRKPDASPPPYTPNGPPHRWIGPGMHDPNGPPGPPHDLMRYPHMPIRGAAPGRMPFDGPRMTSSYMGSRMPRFMGPAGGRMSMYHGTGMPPGGPKIPRQGVPHLQPPHLGHPSESYPFSEKLKEQASIYRTEGMHGGPGGNMPFDMNNPDAPMGPEWGGPYANPASVPPGGRLAHMPETVSPSHGPMPGGMISSAGPVSGPPMDSNLPPGPEPMMTPGGAPMDPSSGLRMANPAMMPPNMPYSKGPNPLPNYTDSPMPGMPPSMGGPMDMHPGGMGVMSMPQDRNASGRMKDAMERRGEPRPPDLKINPVVPGSPSMAFSGAGRHPAPSPRVPHSGPMMGQPPFMHGDVGPGGLPQVSPHHPSVRSPLLTSPGGPISNPNQFMPMGQGGMQQHGVGPMDHPNMMPPNPPLSADRGPPADWGPMPPSSMVPPRTPSSSGMMHSGPGPRPQSAITEMINKMNSYPISLQSPLYQDAVKDTSPPPLTHVNGSNMMATQEPPPLTHPSQHGEPPPGPMPVMGGPMSRTPTGAMMPGAPPGYDPAMSGPRSAGPRPMGPPPMGEGFPNESYRPPSHPEMCMSPGMQQPPQQGMIPPGGAMDIPGGYPMQQQQPPHGGMMAPGGPGGFHGQPPPGMMHGAPPSGGPPSRGIPEFDLSGIIPREKPSETLSYFPSAAGGGGGGGGGAGGQDGGQGDPGAGVQMNVRSPTIQQPRYPNTTMGQRPMTPGGNFPAAGPANPMMRPSGPGSFGNPPSYPPEAHMGGQWDMGPNMARPQMMQNAAPGMHSGYPGGARPLI